MKARSDDIGSAKSSVPSVREEAEAAIRRTWGALDAVRYTAARNHVGVHLGAHFSGAFDKYGKEEDALVALVLAVINEYFLFRPYPDDGRRFVATLETRHLQAMAALFLHEIRGTSMQTLVEQSRDYRILPLADLEAEWEAQSSRLRELWRPARRDR